MSKIIGSSFRMLGKGALILARGHALRKEDGARFSNRKEQKKLFSSSNKGLLIDGNSRRISEKDSFEHVAVIAKPGSGKTTAYIIPNLIDRALQGDSIITLDPSGELYEKTSGFLKKQGYKVLLIDPKDTSRSVRFNPYHGLSMSDLQEVRSISASLVLSRYGNAKDPLWNDGAISLISFFATCLMYKGGQDLHIPAIYSLLLRFGSDGKNLDDWVLDIDHPTDPDNENLAEEWGGIVNSQEKMLQSYLSIAKTALNGMADDSLKWLLSGNDFEFRNFRTEKTILYISFPAHKQADYQFLIDIIYVRCFSAFMERRPLKKDISIYCLLDEFGSSYIKDFDVVVNNIRKYRVSLSLVMQSIAQLKAKYGFHADTIKGGIGSYIVFAGADIITAKEISEAIGKKYVVERNKFSDIVQNQRESNLLNPDQIRTLEDRQAVYLSKNHFAIIFDFVPYWDSPKYSRLVKN